MYLHAYKLYLYIYMHIIYNEFQASEPMCLSPHKTLYIVNCQKIFDKQVYGLLHLTNYLKQLHEVPGS